MPLRWLRSGLAIPPALDLVHAELGCIVGVDEIQHFTTARMTTFDDYPETEAVPGGFDVVSGLRGMLRRMGV